jgi:hypothetical protein
MVFLISIFFGGSTARAVDEQKLIDSGEKLAAAWEQMLTKGCLIVNEVLYWKVKKITGTPGSTKFDIKKSDSIVSPYILVISSVFRYHGQSPERRGFKTPKEALSNIQEADFLENGIPMAMQVIYAYQKGFWVLNDGNKDFNWHIKGNMHVEENMHYFKNLIKVPAQ